MSFVAELSHRYPFIPIILSPVAEHTNILFDFLVNALCLPISLWMICSRYIHANAQHPVKFFNKLPNEYRSTVTNDPFWQSEVAPHPIKEQSCNAFTSDFIVCWYNANTLAQPIHN